MFDVGYTTNSTFLHLMQWLHIKFARYITTLILQLLLSYGIELGNLGFIDVVIIFFWQVILITYTEIVSFLIDIDRSTIVDSIFSVFSPVLLINLLHYIVGVTNNGRNADESDMLNFERKYNCVWEWNPSDPSPMTGISLSHFNS